MVDKKRPLINCPPSELAIRVWWRHYPLWLTIVYNTETTSHRGRMWRQRGWSDWGLQLRERDDLPSDERGCQLFLIGSISVIYKLLGWWLGAELYTILC
jgi:hypothetical protein